MPSISCINSKLIRAQKVERQLFAQLAAANAIENVKQKIDEKRKNARRKIVLGAIAFKYWESNCAAELNLDQVLDENLITRSDRALFGLSEKEEEPAVQEIPNNLGTGNSSSEIKPSNSTTGAVSSDRRFAFSKSENSAKGGNQDI
jgi:hypothetical protein